MRPCPYLATAEFVDVTAAASPVLAALLRALDALVVEGSELVDAVVAAVNTDEDGNAGSMRSLA